jgi:hypothetical protein
VEVTQRIATPPQTWMAALPRRTRAVLTSALEDAVLVAQDCHDEPAERDYLRMLERLEASTV